MKYDYKGKQVDVDVVHIEQDDYYELRAKEKDQIVGTLNFKKSKRNKGVAFLNDITVNEEYMGKGYGNILIKAFEYVALNLNLFLVEGKFYPENNRAKPFYIANGYAIEKDDYDTIVVKTLDREKIKQEIEPRIFGYDIILENNPDM